jgi:excinuclease ABC subunit C
MSNILKSYIENATHQSGIYKMIDQDNNIIYIGKAKNIKQRLSNYIKSDLNTKTLIMVSKIAKIEFIITNSETESLIVESQLIKKHQPKFNILLKDDKSFPYIKLRLDHEYPQIIKYRGKNLTNGLFFGPFASLENIYSTIAELQKIFKLRTCSDHYLKNRIRPCLQYQIGRCLAPCVNKISKEEYNEIVFEVKDFLSGKTHELQRKLSEKMQLLSNELKFEDAAKIRDKIKALTYIQMKSGTFDTNIINADIIAIGKINNQYGINIFFYRNRSAYGNVTYFPDNNEDLETSEILEYFLLNFYQKHNIPSEIIINHVLPNIKSISDILKIKIKVNAKNKLVEIANNNNLIAIENHIKQSMKNDEIFTIIASLFGINKEINRIELYDNSHISGQFAVGAMVVAGKEGFLRKEYRIFNFENINQPDDYRMLENMLTRRFTKMKKDNKIPDLMIIDGGRGHLSVAQKIMGIFNFNIIIVGMSKGVDRNAGCEKFHLSANKNSFTLDKNNPVMKYLQILRDEVHNFAIKTHRKKRSESIRSNSLSVSLIGKTRKQNLLNHFGSYEAIREASVDELSKVKNISKNLAKNIFLKTHNNE